MRGGRGGGGHAAGEPEKKLVSKQKRGRRENCRPGAVQAHKTLEEADTAVSSRTADVLHKKKGLPLCCTSCAACLCRVSLSHLALALEADVAGPLDEPRQVHLGLKTQQHSEDGWCREAQETRDIVRADTWRTSGKTAARARRGDGRRLERDTGGQRAANLPACLLVALS